MIPENTRDILSGALKKGGEVLLEYRGVSGKAVVKESISSVVTEADLAAESAIIETLTGLTDRYNIISEEAGHIYHGSHFTWVIDPLDGTSNFAAGLPWFGVIISLFHETSPVMAGMYLPAFDQLYFASSGKGAWNNGERIHCSGSDDLQEILVAYSFDFNSDPARTADEMKLLVRLSRKIRNTRSTNSLIDFCYTAEGKLGAAINQTTKIWDIAAPWLIIGEAGGRVTDIDGNEMIFDLSPGAVHRNYTIVAAGSLLHPMLMRVIRDR